MEVKPPDPKAGGLNPPPEPIERMLFKLYVKKWASSQREADDKMQALEDTNTKLGRLNSLLAKLGKLHTQVGDSGDAKKLEDALNKDPGLIYQVNQDIKQAGLPEPAFRNSEGSTSEKWVNYRPSVSDIPAFDRSLRVQVLKEVGGRHFSGLQWWFNNQLNLQPSRFEQVTNQQWEDLANRLIAPLPAALTPPLGDIPQTVGSPLWIYDEVRRDFAQRFNEAQASRVPGGLTTSNTGPDLYSAVQIVRSEISNLSNRLQSSTAGVNQAMQMTNAIMSAITDMTQKMFDAKSRAL